MHETRLPHDLVKRATYAPRLSAVRVRNSSRRRNRLDIAARVEQLGFESRRDDVPRDENPYIGLGALRNVGYLVSRLKKWATAVGRCDLLTYRPQLPRAVIQVEQHRSGP